MMIYAGRSTSGSLHEGAPHGTGRHSTLLRCTILLVATGLIAHGAGAQVFSKFSNLYNWEIRPDITDGYEFLTAPQPVCARDASGAKIYLVSNYDGYNSLPKILNTSTRIAEIDTQGTYKMLPASLPGKRWEFTLSAAVGASSSDIYLIGGRNGFGEFADIYLYGTGPGTWGPNPVAQIPAFGTIAGNRSGAATAFVNGKIYLFGGRHAGSALSQVLEFTPPNGPFIELPPMPVALYGARTMVKAAPAGKTYVYLAGGRQIGGAIDYRILRFDATQGSTMTTSFVTGPAGALQIPASPAVPTMTWDPGGVIRIVTGGAYSSGNWGNMQAWVLNDPSPGAASLVSSPYAVPARARDSIGVVKCETYTYVIGGLTGHPTPSKAHARMVDRLAPLGPLKKN